MLDIKGGNLNLPLKAVGDDMDCLPHSGEVTQQHLSYLQ